MPPPLQTTCVSLDIILMFSFSYISDQVFIPGSVMRSDLSSDSSQFEEPPVFIRQSREPSSLLHSGDRGNSETDHISELLCLHVKVDQGRV